uniref:Transposase n=1 Tax=Schistosoma mansoni TaxID=6183 RepID=A0A5K4F4U6_SCHMA
MKGNDIKSYPLSSMCSDFVTDRLRYVMNREYVQSLHCEDDFHYKLTSAIKSLKNGKHWITCSFNSGTLQQFRMELSS